MRSIKILSLLLLCLSAVWCPARAAAATTEDEADQQFAAGGRVARISLLDGGVSLRRAGSGSWEPASLNTVLVEGDTLATNSNARAEIQIDARNFVRLESDSTLTFTTLRDEGVALSLSEGTASIRLARFDHDHEYFEMDAPQTTMAAEQTGLYRLDVGRGDESVQFSVRDGGQARIYSETSGFTLRDGRSASLITDGADAGDWDIAAVPSFDDWDRWVDSRERELAARLSDDGQDRYYDQDVWGAEELSSYGDWSYAGDYGWLWRPRITYINYYDNWAPYRDGHWSWCAPYGWTWVGAEPWGWAPYHFGRWVYFNNGWYWAPRGYYGYGRWRSHWSPALVNFVYLPGAYGQRIAWYPLAYNQPYLYSRYYRQPSVSGQLVNLQLTNPAYLRAVTTLPAGQFGTWRVRPQPASSELARRAVTTQPLLGRLPVAPPNTRLAINTNGRVSTGNARPSPFGHSFAFSERQTGAAPRTPGIALDEGLRRALIFNQHDPRSSVLDLQAARDGANPGGTGAAMRPVNPGRTGTRFESNNVNTPPASRPSRYSGSGPSNGRHESLVIHNRPDSRPAERTPPREIYERPEPRASGPVERPRMERPAPSERRYEPSMPSRHTEQPREAPSRSAPSRSERPASQSHQSSHFSRH